MRQKCLRRKGIRRLEILVLMVISILRVDSAQWVPHPSPVWTLYATNMGGMQRVILQDGTQVDLNTGSEIKVLITGGQREVVLTHGEALFTVVHRPSWPFSVRAGGATIRAVGTKFSVRLRDDEETEVLVIEGRIAIEGGRGARVAHVQRSEGIPRPGATPYVLTVSAGESIGINSTTVMSRAKLSPAALKRRTAWTDGWIWFSKDPLPEAVAEFNRYHREQLVLVDPARARLEIGGRFRSTDMDSFIATLEHSFDVRVVSSAVRETGAATIYLAARCRRAQQQCNWPMVQ
ncbi:MAG: transcriptional regulator [Gammaproteobacteria bacterium]|nr:transcriptional regulator [Gammaproteobacteria bacterium]